MIATTPFDTRPVRPSFGSLRALDGLNFFLATQLAGFGPFVAVYLTDRGWAPDNIGFVLTASGLAGLLTQVPAGELLDMMASKRLLVGVGTIAVALAALIIALWPNFPAVFAASLLQGTAGSILGPGIAAISLGLVGHDVLAERLGRNQRFASIGGFIAAEVMGLIGTFLATRGIFVIIALLEVPALMALIRIRAGDIQYGRSCGADDPRADPPQRAGHAILFKDRRLLIFAICLFLFQIANASILPLIGEAMVRADKEWSPLVMSALIVVPQIIVALIAPWTGRTAERWGRRPLLLIGFAIVPIRSALFLLTTEPMLLVLIQVLDGVTGAVLGVLTALIIADLTKGTGRFNLAQGFVGMFFVLGASLSTSLSGLAVARFGEMAGFLGVTGVALIAVATVWAFMPETKPMTQRGKTATH